MPRFLDEVQRTSIELANTKPGSDTDFINYLIGTLSNDIQENIPEEKWIERIQFARGLAEEK